MSKPAAMPKFLARILRITTNDGVQYWRQASRAFARARRIHNASRGCRSPRRCRNFWRGSCELRRTMECDIGGKLRAHLRARGEYITRLVDVEARGDAEIFGADLANYDERWSAIFAGSFARICARAANT